MTDVKDLLPLYALGALDPAEMQVVDRAVANDPALAAQLAELLDTASELIAEPAPVEPDSEIKSQLMASAGAGKFSSYADQLAKLYDVSSDRANEILAMMERKKNWDLPGPGVALVHFDGGPAVQAADCGFVRLKPGAVFPYHRHVGEEYTVVLSGKLRDRTTGREQGPGDVMILDPDSEHEIECIGDEDVIWAARVFNGIEIGGQRPPKRTP